MKPFILFSVTMTLPFLFGCKSTTDSNVHEKTEHISIKSSEIFEYRTGIGGDEELAAITVDPDHYEISTIVRDSTTNWEAIYRYKPESEFSGIDQAEITLGTGWDGTGSNTNYEVIRFEFTVH